MRMSNMMYCSARRQRGELKEKLYALGAEALQRKNDEDFDIDYNIEERKRLAKKIAEITYVLEKNK